MDYRVCLFWVHLFAFGRAVPSVTRFIGIVLLTKGFLYSLENWSWFSSGYIQHWSRPHNGQVWYCKDRAWLAVLHLSSFLVSVARLGTEWGSRKCYYCSVTAALSASVLVLHGCYCHHDANPLWRLHACFCIRWVSILFCSIFIWQVEWIGETLPTHPAGFIWCMRSHHLMPMITWLAVHRRASGPLLLIFPQPPKPNAK